MTFVRCLNTEYNLTQAFFTSVPDLPAGVKAKLIDKTGTPVWSHQSLREVSDAKVGALFGTDNHQEQLQFLNDRDMANYRVNFGLPRLADLRRLISENRGMRKEALLDGYLELHGHKMGLRQLMVDVFAQHVEETPQGELVWID